MIKNIYTIQHEADHGDTFAHGHFFDRDEAIRVARNTAPGDADINRYVVSVVGYDVDTDEIDEEDLEGIDLNDANALFDAWEMSICDFPDPISYDVVCDHGKWTRENKATNESRDFKVITEARCVYSGTNLTPSNGYICEYRGDLYFIASDEYSIEDAESWAFDIERKWEFEDVNPEYAYYEISAPSVRIDIDAIIRR